MKAVRITRYGSPDVLSVVDVEAPKPKDNEIRVRVLATVAAPPDSAFREGKPLLTRLFIGLRKPKTIPGDVFAGVVEKVGKDVKNFAVGTRVYGSTGMKMGTNAEMVALEHDGALAEMPASVSFAEAAAMSEGSLTALPFLRDGGKIREGSKVLIIGASGGVGVYATQLAKYFGAEVTAVCGAGNFALVRTLGADRVIDYHVEDYTKGHETYDIIFDAVAKSSLAKCKDILKPDGVYLTTVPSVGLMIRSLVGGGFGRKKAIALTTGLREPELKRADLLFLGGLMERGVLRAVIDRTYPLGEIGDAHRYVDTGHKKGSVVVAIS